MRHVTLTCRNHPDLRWHCKSIAFTLKGGYNGQRNLFFAGRYAPGSDLIWPYSDIEPNPDTGKLRVVRECTCSARDLILAPEDKDCGQDRMTD